MTNLANLKHLSGLLERLFSLANCIKTRNTCPLKVKAKEDRLLKKPTVTRHVMECRMEDPAKNQSKF